MNVRDEKLRGASIEIRGSWCAKKALIEDEQCQIAQELRIWTTGHWEDKIQIQLIRADGSKTGIFDMTREQFCDRSPEDFIQDMFRLSDTDERPS